MRKLNIKIPKNYVAKLAISVFGIGIISIASALFFMTDMGADPYQVLCNAIHIQLSITIGMANILMNGTIILLILLFFRKFINIAMVLSLTLSGLFIDGFVTVFEPFINQNLPIPVKIIIIISACILLSFGVYLYTAPALGASPADSVGLIIAKLVKKPYSLIRIFTDVFYTALGFLLGGKVGITTIISVLLTGITIGLFEKILDKTKLMQYIKRNE
ncbi:MAG TPA: hypothetical protein PLT91_06405 [Clostridia bacterium]|nr:MAG: hypothetical protein BWX97_00474 [Firmicutes bacterium ADurb.Bin146]HOD93548.1 hypothetical protein [Clostridia bacterium]HQM39855.1 hypothetical protein [Clostridia bacterium]